MKNMKRNHKHERGQAIIIVVFAIIGLIGMTALTVDGSNAYSNRRHAQNAADTAAFAAARAKVRNEPWKGAALAIAAENGFNDTFADDETSHDRINVEVYGCEEPASECGQYAGNPEYLQVKITSTIDTYFGRVIGIWQVTNRVNSIAQAKPAIVDPTMLGNAMVSLMCGCKGEHSWNRDPFTISGNSVSIVGGSGVFVNSDCNDAFNQNGAASMEAEYGVCVVGTSNYAYGSVSPPPQSGCGVPLPCPPPIIFPNPSCDTNGNGTIDPEEHGTITQISTKPRVYIATPGYYSGGFPSVSPNGKLILQKGVYCLNGNFHLNSTWTITTDVDGNGMHDPATEGVLIKMESGGIRFNGSSYLNLHAMSDPDTPEDLRNLLLYMPPGNTSGLDMNGAAGSEFTGSIWAPSSHCSLEGTNTSYNVNSQVMCFTVSISGSAEIDITYNENQNKIITVPPSVELSK
jgi:Tfp pilus assembly protein PilX